jgi:hypothetical protein
MKRVALLVTGKTEEVLHLSLKRIFPDAEFVMRPRRDGFTSHLLPSPPKLHALGGAPRPTNVERLAAALVAEVEPGRRDEKPPDMVVLVDDMELVNQSQPERIIEHVVTAVRAHIDHHPWSNKGTQEKALERVRQRCSFHVLAPMVEAYFFPDAAALVRAGAKRASAVNAAAVDVENFLVQDPAFLGPPDRAAGVALPPWAVRDRARRPKSYLQFLCDPTGTIPRAYVESEGGRAALEDLDWDAVLSPPSHVRFARSLIHDLADALGQPAVTQRYPGVTHPLTWPPKRDTLLRNI